MTSAAESVGPVRPTLADARRRHLSVLARIAVVVAGIAGACGMAGWIFDVEGLRQIIPGQPPLRFNTGLCFLLVALAWFLPTYLRIFCAAVVAAAGLINLAEYVFGIDRGIDQLFFTDTSAVDHPGRMAVATAASFVLVAAALVLTEVGRRRAAGWCGFVVFVGAALTLLGYAYNVSWLYSIRPVSTVAVHTAGCLFLLGIAMLATLPNVEMGWALRPDDAGAILMRRLLPAALIGLPIVGALALLGERHKLYDVTTSAALIVVAGAFVVAAVTWAAAQRLSRIDGTRALAIAELTELKRDLEGQVQQRAVQLQHRYNEIAVLEDRQRIAADLHDIVIQRLFAAGMFVQGGVGLASDPEVRHRLDTAVEAMDAAIKDLRASIFELAGRRTVPTDLTTAVDDVCVESARMLGFMPDLIVDDPHSVADRVRDDLLAVLREGLANVARHARATAAQVVVRADDDVVSLTVIDDGVGMTGNGRSSGTRNMVQRARAHGGECTWTPVAPHGTQVQWRMPLRAGGAQT